MGFIFQSVNIFLALVADNFAAEEFKGCEVKLYQDINEMHVDRQKQANIAQGFDFLKNDWQSAAKVTAQLNNMLTNPITTKTVCQGKNVH